MSLVFGGLKEYSKILQVLWVAEELKVGSKAFWAYYIFFAVDASIFEKKIFYFLNYHLQYLLGNWIYLIWTQCFYSLNFY